MEECYSRDGNGITETNENTGNRGNVSREMHRVIADLAEELVIKCLKKGQDVEFIDQEHREFIQKESESIAEEFKRILWERFFSLKSEIGYERNSIKEIRKLANEKFDKMLESFEEKLSQKLNKGSADSITILPKDLDLGRRTLALIKPDAYKHADEIIYIMRKHGFFIVQERRVILSPEQACLFYGEHLTKKFSPRLVEHLSSGPVVALCIASAHCPDTVTAWREVMGPCDVTEAAILYPNTLRAKYGTTGDQVKNALHGSHSIEDAEREIHFFFPEIILDPLPKITDIGSILDEESQKTFKKGLVMLRQQKPENPVQWFAHWLLQNNPNQQSLDAKPTIDIDEGTDKSRNKNLNKTV